MKPLSQRERCLLALLLLLAALAFGWFVLLGPLFTGFADRADARAALLATYERDARSVAQIASMRRAADAQRSTAPRFVVAATNPGDALRDRVAAAVAATGGRLRSIEDVAGAAVAGAPATVRVRADTQLTITQLNALLVGLMRGEPLLVVDTLSVAADEAFQTNAPGPMDVRLDVSARIAAPKPR